MKRWQYNLLMFLPTILIRAPIVIPLIILVKIGEVADKILDYSYLLPGMRRE